MELLALDHLFWVLPLLVLAIVAAYWAFKQRRRAIALLTQNAEKCNLRSNAGPIRRRILSTVLLIALILAFLSVLRPIGGTEISEHRRPAKNLIVLLDVSKSMAAVDADGISRMEASKLLLREFINKRPTDRIGLISFAGATYTESPITLDRSILLSKINKLSPDSIPVGGTDIDSALREAENLLTSEPPPGSAIIILSDGDNVTGRKPEAVLTKLRKANVPVISIAVGLDQVDAIIPGSDLSTRSQHATLRNLSDSTKGLFLAASPKEVDSQIAQLSERVDTIELNGENIATEVFERPLDLYAWPLSLSLLCLMIHLFLPLRTKIWRPLSAAFVIAFTLPQAAPAQVADTYLEALDQATEEELPILLIFTGSDWSQLSITFEREILSHSVFQKWADRKVIRTIIDLPRVGLNEDERNGRRALAKKFNVESYPTAVFLDIEGSILGNLTHDPDGPSAWIKRADAILAGERAASDSAASVEYLPSEIRKALEAADITESQRSVRYYNKALELEKAEPELTLASQDRFKLLLDLYKHSASTAPIDRPDLTAAARLKTALLHHQKGQSLTPQSEEEIMQMAQQQQSDPLRILNSAKRSLENAVSTYQKVVPLKPNDKEISSNLALAYKNKNRVQAYLDFFKAYQEAILNTTAAVTQEKHFADSLDREVTTRLDVNTQTIDDSVSAIQDLIAKAEHIKDTPTILPEEGLADYLLAQEDIILAPAPHQARELRVAQGHLQDALDHLIDPQQQQPQPQPQQGEGDEGDAEGDLRRAEKESGDLRDRLMDRLREQNRREGKRIPRRKNH